MRRSTRGGLLAGIVMAGVGVVGVLTGTRTTTTPPPRGDTTGIEYSETVTRYPLWAGLLLVGGIVLVGGTLVSTRIRRE